MHEIAAAHAAFALRPDAEPVVRVHPGEVVRFQTSAAPVERLFAAGERWLAALDVTAINAVTGPVFIEGVEPGDAVAVEIIAIEPGSWGWSAWIPGFGLLGDRAHPPVLRRLPIAGGRVVLSERLAVPVRPMIGCLGLAPAAGASSTLGPPFPWGGNYDLVQARPGNTLLFPVQVAGGLFSLGDLHAAMGTGEATSVAVECAGTATVRLGVRKGLRLETPRIEAPDRLFTVGLHRSDHDRARRQATTLMLAYLTAERGLSRAEAYLLMSAAVDLELGGPAGAVVLASVPWALLPGSAVDA